MDGLGVPGADGPSHGASPGIGIGDGALDDVRGGRPEPGAVVPAAEGVDPGEVVGVLVRHVDVRHPEIAGVRHGGRRPQFQVGSWAAIVAASTKVLSWMIRGIPRPGRSGEQAGVDAGDVGAVDQVLLDLVGQQVTRGLARVDVEAGDAERVVVVEHEPGALLVGVEEGHRPGARVRHVGNVDHADTFGIRRGLSRRGDPLVGRAVADPGGDAAVQVQGGAVLGVTSHPWRAPCPLP